MTEVRNWSQTDAASQLLRPNSRSHKYSRGVLGLRTGSSTYPGAAVLSAEAAWRTGVGLVRYFPPLGDVPPAHGLPTPAAATLAVRPETVCSNDDAASRARCDAWVIGSGTDPAHRSLAETEALRELLAGQTPVVVDAGALGLIADAQITAPVIITPHRGEFTSLWRSLDLGDFPDHDRDAAARLAQAREVTVLLKGARTLVATPDSTVLQCGPATPWLATAGTGDVLAGMLGALVAVTAAHTQTVNHDLLARLGATAAVVHDLCGRTAANDPGANGAGHPITALDVATAVPTVFAQLSEEQ